MLSDDDEDDHCEDTMRATLTHIAKDSVEFEYDFIGALGNQIQIDSTLTEHIIPSMYLYPLITE